MSYPFLQARYYTPGRGGSTVWGIVIHTMETPETVGRAKQVWRWFFGQSAPKASAHYMTDAQTVEQSVKETDTAWAVDDYLMNQATISIELSGMASQTPAEWADAYSQAELALVAKLVADIAKRNGIAIRQLFPSQIKALAGQSKVAPANGGIFGHVDVTKALNIKGGHTDPGNNFPWSTFLGMVRGEYQKLVAPVVPKAAPKPVQLPDTGTGQARRI